MGRKMKRWKGIIKGITAFLMAAVIAMSQIPGTDLVLTAYADSDKTITGLCTGAIGKPTSGAGGWSYVYYGTYGGNDMKYRVLDTAATEFNANTTMLLDCDSTIVNKRFDDDSNVWADSEIKGWLNGNEFYESTDVFTTQEKAAIASSTKTSAASGDGSGWQWLGYVPLTDEHIFLLDAVEATRPLYGYADQPTAHDTRKKDGTSTLWWLRSTGSNDTSVGDVYTTGLFSSWGSVYMSGDPIGVSPAFNLNLESVIFSSEVPGGYKLTVKDENMNITPGTITRDGTTITVPYTITGTNADNANRVSALITDSQYSAGTAVTSGYTYLKLSGDTSGSGTFTLPDAYADKTCGRDYYAYILAEDVNDGTATDYASVPVSITIPDLPQVATPTFSPAAGTYTEAQNVTISCGTTGATIHYTTDGTAPTAASSTYISPINVSGTTTIKAVAVKTGMTDSSVASARYTISETPVDTCTITFEPNGGKGDMDDQTVNKGVRTQLNKNKFTRSGYSFNGWNTRANGSGTGYEDRDYVTVNDNTTLYAQWTKDKPKPDPKEDDDEEENKEPEKPAAVNPDTVEGFFAVSGQPVPGVAMGKTVQGVAAQAVFNATRPAGFLQAFTFNMAINGKVDYTLKNGVLTIIIPKEYRKAGRTFAIMALDKNGRAWVYADTDNNPNTVTATINVEGYAFALIYKD